MLTNLFTWISKIVHLVLITRSSYDEIMAELDDLRDALAKYRAAYSQKKIIDLHNNVALALYRLTLIAEKETPAANATVRKMAKIAKEAIAEITEPADAEAQK